MTSVPAGHCRRFARILRPGAAARCASVHMKVGVEWGREAGQTSNPCSSPAPSQFRCKNQNQEIPAWSRSHLPQPPSYPLPPVSWEHPSARSHLAQPSSTLWPIRQAVPSGVPTLPHPVQGSASAWRPSFREGWALRSPRCSHAGPLLLGRRPERGCPCAPPASGSSSETARRRHQMFALLDAGLWGGWQSFHLWFSGPCLGWG